MSLALGVTGVFGCLWTNYKKQLVLKMVGFFVSLITGGSLVTLRAEMTTWPLGDHWGITGGSLRSFGGATTKRIPFSIVR